MYKNQLQEFAQRTCINLPSYSSIREGPDHAPRFKVKVNFDGEFFESPKFCSTLRQAEHAAAEVALKTLSQRGPSRALATRVLDETGVYKNLLQETAHRAGMKLPAYTTVRSGPGYAPVFTCTVELAGMCFSGDPAKTKKQAQKSAAMAAWFALKELSQECSSSYDLSDLARKDEQEQVIVARYLSRIKLPDTRKLLGRGKNKSQRGYFPAKGNVIPYSYGWSSYRMPNQNSGYSYLSPEFTMYQGVPRQQSHLLALPSTSTSIPTPRLFPLIRSIFRPDMNTIFCTREQELLPLAPGASPVFYLPNSLLPVLGRNSSHVIIEEIEDNNQVQEEWLSHDISPFCWSNISKSVSGSSYSSHQPQSLNIASNVGVQVLQNITDDKDQSTDERRKSNQPPQAQECEDFSWLPPGFICNRESIVESRVNTMHPENHGSVSMLSDAQHPSSPAGIRGSVFIPGVSCVRGRNPGTVSSASHPPEGLNSFIPASMPTRPPAGFTIPIRPPRLEDTRHLCRMPCASQMAPAVQIRSVMPVCSSPVRRPRPPSPIQQGSSSSQQEKMTAEETGLDISGTSSEFCRLKI